MLKFMLTVTLLSSSQAVASDCSVTLYGDSVLNGAYTILPTREVHRLDEPPSDTIQRLRPKYRVDDRTKNGQMAAELAETFVEDERSTRFVVIENGIIDAWRDKPMGEHLRSMAADVREEGRIPILTGLSKYVRYDDPEPGYAMTPEMVSLRDEYHQQIKQMAAEEGFAFADFGLAPFNGASDLKDAVHPDKPYSDRLVERLLATLDTIAPECR